MKAGRISQNQSRHPSNELAKYKYGLHRDGGDDDVEMNSRIMRNLRAHILFTDEGQPERERLMAFKKR